MNYGIRMIVVLLCLLTGTAYAAPLAQMKIKSLQNDDGTFTYFVKLINQGPILPNVTTPKDNTITDWNTVPPTTYDAAGKYLTDDENIAYFGIDTGLDDIVVTDIRNGESIFHGMVEQGYNDFDGDGVKNTVVAWHLPFNGWTLADTIAPGNKLEDLRFTADKKIEKIVFWVGGTDDAVIWDDSHIMLEDGFGIFDATVGEYLAVLFEREIPVKSIRCRQCEAPLSR